MNSHYYRLEKDLKSHEIVHDVHVANLTLKLITDHGVFSKTGLDFGSRTLIESLTSIAIEDGDILDVGCGYGPMGISAGKLLNRHVDMVDVNERAIMLANKNVALNHVKGKAFYSSIYENVIKTDYALIISNPPIRAGKAVVHAIIENSKQYLRPLGQCVIVIQKKQGAPSAEKKMLETFGNVTLLAKEKGYWILKSEKI